MNYKKKSYSFCFEENDEKKRQTINFNLNRIVNIYID